MIIKRENNIFLQKMYNVVMHLYDSAYHFIISLKSKINKQKTVKKLNTPEKHDDIKVVKVKIKKVTVRQK